MIGESYTVSKARYAKGMLAIRCEAVQGCKGRAHRLAEGIKGRWTHRDRAYLMSPTKERKLAKLLADGWDWSFIMRQFEPPQSLEVPASVKIRYLAQGGRPLYLCYGKVNGFGCYWVESEAEKRLTPERFCTLARFHEIRDEVREDFCSVQVEIESGECQ